MKSFDIFRTIIQNKDLLWSLTKRDIVAKYRGSLLGSVWAVLTPLLMLAVYTMVFGVVFNARWDIGDRGTAGSGEYALVMFIGLMVYNVLAEPILRSSNVIVDHANYVKKIVFPLKLFPVMLSLSGMVQSFISLLIWYFFYVLFFGVPPITGFIYILILVPLVVLTMGIALILAALGVFLRDLSQIVGIIIPAMMFLSPIFYPRDALPPLMQSVLLYVNPVALPIEQARTVMIGGEMPNWLALGAYTLVAAITLFAGVWIFNTLRRGFSDVL